MVAAKLFAAKPKSYEISANSNKSRIPRVRRFITVTSLAVLLIFGCVQGALWQYDRHQARHAKNELIVSNIAKPAIAEKDLVTLENSKLAWRTITLKGSFIPEKETLIRNRYHEGKYGFGVVTLFKSASGKFYWVDRGWVIAGKDALTPPVTQMTNNSELEITARVRIEDIESQVRGSVFAVPQGNSTNTLTQWDQEQSLTSEPFYFDLFSASDPELTPRVPTALPTISDGPHLAYTFQWVLFILMIILAWYLVLREDKKSQAEKL